MLALTVAAVSLGVVVGFLRGGRLSRLANFSLRWPWLAAIAWIAQLVLFGVGFPPSLQQFEVPFFFASMALVALVLVLNRRVPGLTLFGVGLVLNALVMAANGGFMPVSDSALYAAGSGSTVDAMRTNGRVQKTFLMQADTALWFLGDVLPFPPIGKVYSVGDVVAGLGAFWLVVGGMGRGDRLLAISHS